MRLSLTIKDPDLQEISSRDLHILLDLYDREFLDNFFKNEYRGKLKFSLSNRMTRSAALTLCPRNMNVIKPEEVMIEFRVGVDFFFRYKSLERAKSVCGIQTSNALEALQLVFEHEICHAIEFIKFHKSSCKGKRFKEMANSIFGHNSSYHELPTTKELAREKLGLHIGDPVSFLFEGQKLNGVINGINKRATVMVPNKKGQYADKKGKRYMKYYVPLNEILK